MKKKILAGTVALGVAVTFWACGSGDILTMMEPEDTTMLLPDSGVGPLLDPIMDPSVCPGCYGEAPESSSSRQATVAKFGSSSSSLRELPTFSSVSLSSSSSEEGIVVNLSSSSRFVPPVRSSSSETPVVLSSSSGDVVKPGADVGSCAPLTPTIDVGQAATWKYTRGNDVQPSQLLSASYTWTFEGGTPATTTATGANATKQENITYATSGQHTASVVITIGGSHYTVTCSPLQVNGAKITGCSCTAVNKKPDIAQGEMGTWNITGCKTTAPATITGYAWGNGVTGDGEMGVFAFTKKNETLAPVVNVSNNDNTIQSVQCEAITAINSDDPDYILTKQNTKIALPKGESTLVLDLPASWHAGNSASPKIRCDGANQPIVITIGTKSSLSDYSATIEIPVEQTINKSAVSINLSVGANCQVE